MTAKYKTHKQQKQNKKVQYFIWSKADALNFITVKYSLHYFSETISH